MFCCFSPYTCFRRFVLVVLVISLVSAVLFPPFWSFHSFSICNKDMHYLRAYLHRGGEPQIHEVTCARSPHLSNKLDKISMRDHMDSRVTPPYLLVNRPLIRLQKVHSSHLINIILNSFYTRMILTKTLNRQPIYFKYYTDILLSLFVHITLL